MFLDKDELDGCFISNFSLVKLVRGTKYFDLKTQIKEKKNRKAVRLQQNKKANLISF